MHARLSEVHNLRDKISKKTHLEEVFHVSSSENIADICTRKDSYLKNLGPNSRWQRGPEWLSTPCHQWPCSREFTLKDLPEEETKSPIRVVLAASKKEVFTSSMVKFAMEEHWNFTQAAFSIAKSILRIKILRRMFAPFSECLRQAKDLMFEVSME